MAVSTKSAAVLLLLVCAVLFEAPTSEAYQECFKRCTKICVNEYHKTPLYCKGSCSGGCLFITEGNTDEEDKLMEVVKTMAAQN
ncbi:hypothetical protein ACLOJK_038531 [Asimina triloba]